MSANFYANQLLTLLRSRPSLPIAIFPGNKFEFVSLDFSFVYEGYSHIENYELFKHLMLRKAKIDLKNSSSFLISVNGFEFYFINSTKFERVPNGINETASLIERLYTAAIMQDPEQTLSCINNINV